MRWPLWRVAVAERSMEPALRPGDWLLVRRGSGRAGRPGSGPASWSSPGTRAARTCCWSSGPPGASRRAGGWNRTTPVPARSDSRTFGAVPDRLIEGRVLLRYWPRAGAARRAASGRRRYGKRPAARRRGSRPARRRTPAALSQAGRRPGISATARLGRLELAGLPLDQVEHLLPWAAGWPSPSSR